MQFSSLIWPPQSAEARRVSILVCRVYLIYYIFWLNLARLASCLVPPSFTLKCTLLLYVLAGKFIKERRGGGHKPISSSFFAFVFPSASLLPSEAALLKIRPGGFFNVSLEVGFFSPLSISPSLLSPGMPTPHSPCFHTWPKTTFFLVLFFSLVFYLGSITNSSPWNSTRELYIFTAPVFFFLFFFFRKVEVALFVLTLFFLFLFAEGRFSFYSIYSEVNP